MQCNRCLNVIILFLIEKNGKKEGTVVINLGKMTLFRCENSIFAAETEYIFLCYESKQMEYRRIVCAVSVWKLQQR